MRSQQVAADEECSVEPALAFSCEVSVIAAETPLTGNDMEGDSGEGIRALWLGCGFAGKVDVVTVNGVVRH